MKQIFSVYMSTIGLVLSAIFGGLDGLIKALIILTVIDYISGVAKAIIKKELNSNIGYVGIIKKILIFFIVAVANIIDMQIIKNGSLLRDASIMFYIANESISILENLAKCGVPIPKKLKEILEQLKEEK